ncbi:MAG: CRISPR-associated endonuclease Cas1 [Desulfosalsimonadaceae bacterium]
MIAYIKTQGAKIIREGRHLLVKQGDDTCNTLFTYRLSQLILFGKIEITHPALCALMKNNIDTVFLTRNGRYLGRLSPVEPKNVFLRKRQFQLVDDPAFGLKIAKSIVAGKLANMTTIMMRIKRSRNSPEAGLKAKEIQNLFDRLAEADTIDSIRGYEGRGSAIYFSGLRFGFVENMGFTRRVRRPPTDPVNSVLSLLYTFLMNRVYAAVRISALDPCPGFLHTLDYGRYSLVLDLMEEFRSIVADTLTLSLFNLKILQKTDFRAEVPLAVPQTETLSECRIPDVTTDPIGRMTTNADGGEASETGSGAAFDLPEQRLDPSPVTPDQMTGKYPITLQPEAFARVIDAFEKKLTTSFYYAPLERNITYGDAIIQQAAHYRKVIEGEADVYQPLLLK